ncbi:MAG: nuclear transport factor 2 family protein [Pseudomonadota bacterium]
MDQSDAETFVARFHDVRKSNDAEAIMEFFVDQPEFCISGQCRATSIAARHEKTDDFTALAQHLTSTWSWINVVFHNIVVSDDLLITRYTLTVRHLPTDRQTETDIVDFMRMRDGKVASMTQYVDTAHLSAIALGDG